MASHWSSYASCVSRPRTTVFFLFLLSSFRVNRTPTSTSLNSTHISSTTMRDLESRYEPLRGQRPPLKSPLRRDRPESLGGPLFGPKYGAGPSPLAAGSPGVHALQFVSATSASIKGSREVLAEGQAKGAELPAKYIGPEMKRNSLSLKRRNTWSAGSGSAGRPRQIRQGLRWWLPEFAWVFVSILCVIVIAVGLRYFDGLPPPNWPGALNLNTFLAFFTSLAHFAYTVPVLEGLGQLRWLRPSRQPRSLSEFDVIDHAARGSYGGVAVLFSSAGGLLGSLGALVIILGILTSATTQEVIAYRNSPHPVAGLAQADRLAYFMRSPGNGDNPKFDTSDILSMRGAIVTGAYYSELDGNHEDGASFASQGSVTCGTTDCTWPDFTSLAICTKIETVTGQLKVTAESDSNYRATLAAANLTLVAPNLRSLAVGVSSAASISFKGSEVELAILDTYLIYGSPSSSDAPPTFHAAEILYHWCAQSYSVSVSSGNLRIVVKDIPSALTGDATTTLAAQFNKNITSLPPGSQIPSEFSGQVTLRTQNPDTALLIDKPTALAFSHLLTQPFGGVDNSLPRGGNFLIQPDSQVLQASGDLAWPLGLALFPSPSQPPDPQAQLQAITNITANIAASLNSWLRASGETFTDNNHTVAGTASETSMYVVIYWGWLAFLACQIILSAVFLAIVVVWTRRARVPVLKTSSLAAMAALDGQARMILGGVDDLAGLKERAANVKVKVEGGEEEGGFMWLAGARGASEMGFTGGLTELRRKRYAWEKRVETERDGEGVQDEEERLATRYDVLMGGSASAPTTPRR
ncbi:hypothetical protein B0T25DRAFT_613123 [Lasiosphaeria hispida]|uniref:Uncharacterized protein n=1 Tax=Lasiosphaeria hispida TaxID=260671 RepID=A0AAJ0HBJ1_9PEZI|nr:hypothetical protein B0T25DRAFT_613123 [Lasiosphaeria hispida]